MYLNIRFILVKLTVNFSQYESFTVSTAEFALSEQRQRCGARRRVACTSWREVSAASRQAETLSDGLTAPGSSSRNAWMGSSPAMAAEKRSRCPCVAKGRRRVGAPHSFCHASAQPLRPRMLPAVDELRAAGRNQCMQCSTVEPGLPVMRREARQWALLHRHDLHRVVQRHQPAGRCQGKSCAISVNTR